MPKETWLIGGALTVAFLIGLLTFNSCERKSDSERAQAEMAAAQTAAAKTEAELADLKEQLAQRQARIEALQKEQETTVQTHRTLEDEMRAALESKDVTISQLQGKLTVNI